MRSPVLLSLLSITAVSLTAIPTPSHAELKIVGGRAVGSSELEAKTTVALLTITPQGVGTCTASILASDILVTAAHCVTDGFGRAYPAKQLRIIFHTNVDLGIDDNRPATGVKVNPKWNGGSLNGKDQGDIAIVHFKGGLPSGYQSAKLLPSSQSLKKGESVTLAGYGVTQMTPFGGTGSGVLRKVDNVKISNPKFAKTEVLLDQRQGRGACHGDSGGPAFVKRNNVVYLWGVTNRGYPPTGPDDCKQYSIYTRIQGHASFVNQSVSDLRKAQ